MFGVFGELGVLGKQCTSSKAVMLYTLTMTSDVNFFNATVRGLENEELVVQARRRHGLKTMDGVMDLPRKPSDAEHEAVLGRLTSALGAMPSDTDVQTWLGAELVAAIAAMKWTSASAPSPRRTVAEPRKLAAGPGNALPSMIQVRVRHPAQGPYPGLHPSKSRSKSGLRTRHKSLTRT